ncbi:MAG: CHASE2 domain-containing protein [Staphylococcus sp.]|nr:CHASE2 domain-containing protein [Staphylococcus sp.]
MNDDTRHNNLETEKPDNPSATENGDGKNESANGTPEQNHPKIPWKWDKKRWIHAADISIVLLLTGVLAWMMKFDPFLPIQQATDFNSSDFYDRVAYYNQDRKVSNNVVIVAADSLLTRGEIGELLSRIGDLKPAAIGLDVIMLGEIDPEGEAEVLAALDKLPDIVLPISVTEEGKIDPASDSFYFEIFPDYNKGVVTFISEGNNGLERFFTTEFEMTDGSRLPSMGLALARMKDAEATAGFMNDASVKERLNFNIATPLVMNPGEITPDNAYLIEGKIVMVGDMNNQGDLHNTAIDGRLPGILLNAATAETILTGKRIVQMPAWTVDLLAFLLVATVAALYSFCIDRPWHIIAIMGIKLTLAVLILFGGYWIYRRFSITIDFTYTVALLGFSLMLCDLWFSLTRWLLPCMKIKDRETATESPSVENDKS